MATAAAAGFQGWQSSFERASADALLNFSQLKPGVKEHLARVYATLCAAVALAAAGAYADIALHLGGTATLLGSVFGTLWLGVTPPRPGNQPTRLGVLGLVAFCQGCSLGGLVEAVAQVNPAIIVSAFAATSACFACFSLAALVSRRRSFLYLGGLLSSALCVMMVLQLGGLFLGLRAAASAELYLGLMVFMAYVIFDTQVIVEQADAGRRDFVVHAQNLFVDFVSIFVRLVVILTKREQEKEKRRSEGKSRQ